VVSSAAHDTRLRCPIPLEARISGYSSGARRPRPELRQHQRSKWTDLTTSQLRKRQRVPQAFTAAGAGDVTPPTTTVSGADGKWQSHGRDPAFHILRRRLRCGPHRHSISGGTWTQGLLLTIPAPANHSATVSIPSATPSLDHAGNLDSRPKTCQVMIDRSAPPAPQGTLS